jgi:mRNA-degrading endonuclease toxin of MazEF toxin-antitoxin module
MAIIEDVKNSLTNCQNTLQNFLDGIAATTPIDDDALTLRDEYFKWTDMKTNFLKNENNFVLPYNALPNKISEYIYNYLYQDKKDMIDKHYKKDSVTGDFIINANKKNVPLSDTESLIHSAILRRGNVVWVNFGFNIGREFRGKHPALILKNVKATMIVLPLSSQTPNDPDINVEVDRVYGLPPKTRWGNILRITPVSIIRIDFNSPVGSVKNNVLIDVSAKIKAHGIK